MNTCLFNYRNQMSGFSEHSSEPGRSFHFPGPFKIEGSCDGHCCEDARRPQFPHQLNQLQ